MPTPLDDSASPDATTTASTKALLKQHRMLKLWVIQNSHPFNKISIALLATAGLAVSSCSSDDTSASDFSVVSPGTLTRAVQVDYPPFIFALEGQQVGFEVDLCGEIAQRLELDLLLAPTEFVDLIDSVESNRIRATSFSDL